MKKNIHISVVSPVFKAEDIISELVNQVCKSVSTITDNFEIILVNDASPDNSWLVIKAECEKDKRVKAIDLSRNFGQHYAITAGLKYAKGEWVVVMDCDLQDRPDEIPNLYNKAREGWDIVYARRFERQDKLIKRLFSRAFNIILMYFSEMNFNKASNFGIYNQKVIAEYNKMQEYFRSFPSLVHYLGFKSCTIDVHHSKRYSGESSYNFRKLFQLAFDVIISNTNKPLKITVKFGFLISLLSFLIAIYNVIAHLIGIITLSGFTTTVFSIWFVGGIILSVLGIIGLYIGKIFDQVKNRQLFIISESINVD